MFQKCQFKRHLKNVSSKDSLSGKILIHLPWKSLECVLRVGYIVVARTFLFPLQNQLAKIKVVELGPLY